MKNYSVTAIVAVLMILAFAVTALANGAVPRTAPTVQPAPSAVQPAPAPPVGAGPAAVPAPPATTGTTAQRCFTTSELVTMTVSEAWMQSGQNYDSMGDIVSHLVGVSSQKRGVTIPDTREAGTELGRLIRQRAEADPNQLLYTVVDSAVRDYARTHNLQPAG